LVSVTSLVAAVASLPFGVLADRVRRTWVLGGAITLWGAAMIWSAAVGSFGELLLARVFLGGVTAAAGPMVASLVGDYFPAAERLRLLLPRRRPDVRDRVHDQAIRDRPGAREPAAPRRRRRRRCGCARGRRDRRPAPAPRLPERPHPRRRGRRDGGGDPVRAG